LLLRWVILAVALGATTLITFGLFGSRRADRQKRDEVPAFESQA
jgi:hypothetical protein